MRSIITILFCIGALALHGQITENPRAVKKQGFVLTGGGPGLYGSLSYSNFITPSVDLELGVGPVAVFAGVKYHIGGSKNKNWTPYIGGNIVNVWIFDIFDDDDESSLIGYFPVGIHYLSLNGLNLAIELGPIFTGDEFITFGALKLGYRF